MTEFSINSGKGKGLTREQFRQVSSVHSRASTYRWLPGEKVLSRWSDGLLYIGEILEADNINQRCLIRYEDLSVYWIMFKDIQKESFEHSDIICCLCNSGVSENPNEIVICDNCGAGYHQNCHVPRISATTLQLEDEWNCRQCVFASTARKGGASNTGSTAKTMQNFKQILPYDLKSLSWDSQHKRNIQQTYCYCGGPGSWLMKMLQCFSCQQWFHEACIQCLERPLFLGDRFFIFICSACTSGAEFIQRLNLTWLELVHLILFNLSVVEKKTYWDTEKIVNYIHSFWDDLQMSEEMKEAPSRDEIRRNVVNALENNRTKFKSGRETKKKACLWGLRCRTPPNCVPSLTCSKEQLLAKKLSQINKALKTDGLTMSTRRLRSKGNDSDNYSYGSLLEPFPTPPPEESSSLSECSVKKLRHRLKSALETTPTQTKSVEESNVRNGNEEVVDADRKILKKSTSRGLKRKRESTRSLRSSCRVKPTMNGGVSTSCDDDTSSRGTLNSIIPPPKNFDGQNNPFSSVTTMSAATTHNRSTSASFRSTNGVGRNKLGRGGRAAAGVNRELNGGLRNRGNARSELRNSVNQQLQYNGSHHHQQDGNFNMEKSSFSLICDPFVDSHQSVTTVAKTFYPGFSHVTAALSYNNLKTSVNNYFGAASRMANGEKFKVLASRLTQLDFCASPDILMA